MRDLCTKVGKAPGYLRTFPWFCLSGAGYRLQFMGARRGGRELETSQMIETSRPGWEQGLILEA